jgi:hypothetical protein
VCEEWQGEKCVKQSPKVRTFPKQGAYDKMIIESKPTTSKCPSLRISIFYNSNLF